MKYCVRCGKKLADDAKFCDECGKKVADTDFPDDMNSLQDEGRTYENGLVCPRCSGHNITVQTFQENEGSSTVERTKSNYNEKGHGCLWWLFIGWWWWMVDVMLWIIAFPFKLIQALTRKRKYVGNATTVSHTVTKLNYRTICTCQNCGYSWNQQ